MATSIGAVLSSFDELEWWGDCANTFHEEQKQLVYAARMGLRADWNGAHPPTFDLENRAVLDIGGGPVSLLLKCVNLGACCDVLDPAAFPSWVADRYTAHHVTLHQERGENADAMPAASHDECWLYNVLQHADDPAKVIENARCWASVVRVFDWVGVDPYPGHPHRLEREQLDRWLGGSGFVARVDEAGAVGLAYYGVFSSI